MNQQVLDRVSASVKGFRLPRYDQLPGMGLYLEQVAVYLSDCLSCLSGLSITGSMISNYVKKGLVSNPVKKQYSREQIAYLMYIAVAKMVLSMEDIHLSVAVQQQSYTPQRAYDYFCCELENVLEYVFGLKDQLDTVGVDATAEKVMLRNTIITVAHKVYLNALFEELHKEQEG